MARNCTSWPEAAMEKIKAAWLSGESAGQVAKRFNGKFGGREVTRNVVIGLVHRYGWGDGRGAASKPGTAKTAKTVKAARPRMVVSTITGLPYVKGSPGRPVEVAARPAPKVVPGSTPPSKTAVRPATAPDCRLPERGPTTTSLRSWSPSPTSGEEQDIMRHSPAAMATALVPILDLGVGMCRFSDTEHKGEAFFCGAPVVQRRNGKPSSWCAHHYGRVFTKEAAPWTGSRADTTKRFGQRWGKPTV